MFSDDARKCLIEKCNSAHKWNLLIKESAALEFLCKDSIVLNWGDQAWRDLYFAAANDLPGRVQGKPYQHWYEVVSERLSLFWGAVASGEITGCLPDA